MVINVISLFNGMGTLRQALNDLNIKVNKYYSSEIKPYAIELTQHHFPDTIQVGDIKNWKSWDIDWATIDFIGSGSPCQDLSVAGKRAGINGSRSSLFFVFIDILEHVKKLNPNVIFLQENVGSAPKLDVGIMSRALGVYPARINSKLVTAQLRDRYYWSNIRTKQDGFFGDIVTDIPQPKDRKIMFKDIITDGSVKRKKSGALYQVMNKCFIKDLDKENIMLQKRIKKCKQNPPLVYVDTNKYSCLNTKSGKSDKEKHTCLNTNSGIGGTQIYLKHRNKTTGMIPLIYKQDNDLRVKTNTVKGYDIMTENDCLDLNFPTSKTRRGRVTKGKSPCLMEGSQNLYKYDGLNVITVNKIEMCRLQGFTDDYCDILTKAKAGSLLGDGWTLPIIIHILSFYKNN